MKGHGGGWAEPGGAAWEVGMAGQQQQAQRRRHRRDRRRTCARHRGTALLAAALLAGTALIPAALAEVRTDGSVGPRVRLRGADIEVGADLGRRAGDNLFHSFERFDVDTGGRVTFTGPGDIRRVVGRVTGGKASSIDGTIASRVGTADVYLVNPAGILFGPNARLDVPASFHASTADELRFEDGSVFSATQPDSGVLSVAAPESFGFLGGGAGALTVNGSVLQVAPTATLSLVGGPVEVRGGGTGALAAGNMHLASATGEGEVPVSPVRDATGPKGDILVTDRGSLSVDVQGGGLIRIQADDLTVEDRSLLAASTLGVGNANGIIASLDGDLLLRNSLLTAGSFGSGAAGGIVVQARNVTLDGGQINASALSTGPAGTVVVQAPGGKVSIGGEVLPDQPRPVIGSDLLEARPGLFAATQGNTTNPGSGVLVEASEVAIDNGLISSITRGFAPGSPLIVRADRLLMTNRAAISAETFGFGNGSDITITAPDQLLVDNSFIGSSNSNQFAFGNGGLVQIVAGDVEFVNEGRIFNGTLGFGNAGTVFVRADTLRIDGTVDHEAVNNTGITATAETGSFGSTPPVLVQARTIEVVNGGRIAASTRGFGNAGLVAVLAEESLDVSGSGVFGPSNISVSAENGLSAANAGQVLLGGALDDAGNVIGRPDIALDDGGQVQAFVNGTGVSGGVFITNARSLSLDHGASITAESALVDAGNIVAETDRSIELRRSRITTSAAGGQGGGGNIRLSSGFFVANDSTVLAQALEGAGGNIDIEADPIARSVGSSFDASSALGIDGTVETSTPEVDLSSSFVISAGAFLDADSLLGASCAARRVGQTSTFTRVGSKGGLPPSPDHPLAADWDEPGGDGDDASSSADAAPMRLAALNCDPAALTVP